MHAEFVSVGEDDFVLRSHQTAFVAAMVMRGMREERAAAIQCTSVDDDVTRGMSAVVANCGGNRADDARPVLQLYDTRDVENGE